jgi:rhombotail lipoprotein
MSKLRTVMGLLSLAGMLSGCAVVQHAFCAPGCQTQAHNSSSLVSFLYPDGKTPPPTNTIPELHVPLRVGLAFLPSQSVGGAAPISAEQKRWAISRRS